ncbi:MAG TPA: aldose 1-epimerase family protein [Mycobacteriales bacterium]|nr:aldose 1-epimerase family protein [Mycobacteriales bacterium]
MTAPSGDQYELRHRDHRAVVVSVGGGLRIYEVGDRPVLDGYPEDAMADGARAQTLVPWPNRVKDGQWRWQGRDLQLTLTEPEQHNAIHGLVRWMPWALLEQSTAAVSLGCTSYPQPGYPWPFQVRNDYSLDDDGITVRTTITNLGGEPMPVAAGSHPYLTVGTPTIDSAVLHLPADTWLPTGEQQIPTGRAAVRGSDFDFREPRPLGSVEIDYTFTDLHRDSDGRFRLRLSAPDDSAATTFWIGPEFDFVEIFTGDALPDESRRRRGLGVEPMTAPPNALASGESVIVLAPEESWSGSWGIRPE